MPDAASRPARLLGLDLARGIAIFGMFVAHVGPDAWIPASSNDPSVMGDGSGTTVWIWEIFHSTMPAMFALLAGVSMALMAGGLVPRFGRDRARVSVRILVRAAVLAVLGVVLTALHTPAMVILVYFALYFVLALPFLGMRARTLAWIAGVWAVAGPIASWVIRAATDTDSVIFRYPLSGDYPAMTWMPFVIAGMALGRMDLRDAAVRAKLVIVGAATALLAYGGAAIVAAAGLRDSLTEQIAGTLTDVGSELHPFLSNAQYAATVHSETGVTPTTSSGWLLVAAPHSGSIVDVVGCLGVCLAVVGLCLPLGDRLGRAARTWWGKTASLVGQAVVAAGAMSLTMYTAHIVGMWLIEKTTGHSFAPGQSVWMLMGFTVVLFAGALVWQRLLGRGPLEIPLNWLSTTIADVVVPRRAAAQSTESPRITKEHHL